MGLQLHREMLLSLGTKKAPKTFFKNLPGLFSQKETGFWLAC